MNTEKQLGISPSGSVTAPDVHDGLLVGLIMLPGKRVVLAITDVRKAVHCIQLTGIAGMRVDGLREGNIILDVTVQTGTAVRPEDVARGLGIEGNAAYEQHLSQTMKRFSAKELLLVQLNPSYGAELTCICAGIDLAPSWATTINHLFSSLDEGTSPV
jgi:hypothetical protein